MCFIRIYWVVEVMKNKYRVDYLKVSLNYLSKRNYKEGRKKFMVFF